MEQIARGMKKLGLTIDHILTSPYVRAAQTAKIAATVLGLEKGLKIEPLLAAEQEPRALLSKLEDWEWDSLSVMLVGHEPYLSELASLMIGAEHGCAIRMKKGGLCKLVVRQLTPRPWARLDWLLAPKQLRAIGG
jgi:phosphohistidine phosphatase